MNMINPRISEMSLATLILTKNQNIEVLRSLTVGVSRSGWEATQPICRTTLPRGLAILPARTRCRLHAVLGGGSETLSLRTPARLT